MNKFKYGFLDPESTEKSEFEKFYDKLQLKYKPFFVYFFELNSFCHKNIELLNVKEIEGGQNKLCIALFLECLEIFQGVFILTQKGMIQPARIILRSMVETVCLLEKVANDESYIKKYLEQSKFNEKEALKILDENNFPTPSIDISEEIIKITEKIKSIDKIIIKDLIKTSKCPSLWIVYFELSQSVHSTPYDIIRQYLADNGQFLYGPREERIDLIFTGLFSVVLIALTEINSKFNLNLDEEIDNLNKEYLKIRQYNKC